MNKISNMNDANLIRALNPGTKVEYEVKHTTLLNNAVFVTARYLASQLKIDIFDYKDIFSQNFVKEIYPDEYNMEIPDFDKYDDIVDEIINRMQKMQDNLKIYCKRNINKLSNDDLNSISFQVLNSIYNNGDCLPSSYKGLKDNLFNYIGFAEDNASMIEDSVTLLGEYLGKNRKGTSLYSII